MGLVFVGFAHTGGSEARELLFPFDRPRHRAVTTQAALDWVRRHLLGAEPVVPRYVRRH